MFNIGEYRQSPDRLSDLLPWAAIVRPGIVLNKDGSFQQTIRFRGPDLESSTENQLVVASARLNNALKRLGSGWAFFVEARRLQALKYPDSAGFSNLAALLVDVERRAIFEREQENYESVYFLTIQYLSPREASSRVSKFVFSAGREETEALTTHDYDKILDHFSVHVVRLFDILKDFMFDIALLNDSETLTYLHSCISSKGHVIKVPEVPCYLDSILPDEPLVGGLEPRLGDTFLKTISILGFPSASFPAILDQMNYLPMEYRWVTRYLPLDKLDAEKSLKVYRRQWFSKRKGLLNMLSEVFSKTESAMVDTASMRKSQDADQAMQSLADDYVSFGYMTITIVVWDKNYAIAQAKVREVERVINGLGFTTVDETINAVDAWLSSIPGHVYANVRMPLLHSLNLSHMIPFSAVWAGPDKNEHLGGPPLLYARTGGNTPFRLSNHVGDVGHQMIIGPTGAGKSVLMALMAFQFLRYKNAQVFIFDKGGSFLVPTYAVQGHYYEVGSLEGNGLVFQPLAFIDQERERIWAQDWVLSLIEQAKIEVTPQIKELVWDALTNLSAVPAKQRTMTGLKVLIQDVKIRLVLDPFTLGGPYGDILDADQEVFYGQAWQCFEMEKLMQMPEVIAPVLTYLFHVLEKRFDGRPTLMILDEAWLFLDNPIFSAKIREWLKTLRKLNVSVIFATQSIDDTLASQISSALLESCPSRIFLPNDRALEPNIHHAYETLGLNERQIGILAQATPKKQYYFQSNKGNALFDLEVGQLALALCGASRPEQKKFAKELWAKHGEKGFLKAYLEALKIEWALSFLEDKASA